MASATDRDAVDLQALRERSGWKLQPARAEDHRPLLAGWIAADADHAGKVNAAKWLERVPGVENIIVIDRHAPLFFLRCSNAMRLDIQFAPNADRRIAMALQTGLPWLANEARARTYRELIYESRSPRLIRFLERIGFRETTTEHVLAL